jgi:hypothetical protein
MERDRGQHIRARAEYAALAEPIFESVNSTIYDNLLRIPYSLCMLECEGTRVAVE